MDAVHSSSYCASEQMDGLNLGECKSTNNTNASHIFEAFEVLKSLHEDKVLCDVRLKADDDTIVFGHKIVLMSASQYFRDMFTNFSEYKIDIVDMRELNSTALKLLVDYIYTGKIRVSKENVQVLLPAANLFQLDYVKSTCVKFLQKQLDPFNCLSIRSFADLHNCFELLSSSEEYIRKKFLDVVEGEEFLSLSAEELIKFISGNFLNAPEEKVCECVINWVKHELNVRYDSLPKLMKHVRLPLASLEYISKVVKEPLFTNIPKIKDYVIEALQFHALKRQQLTISQSIRNTPRKSGQKVILVFDSSLHTYWYDPITKLWKLLPENSLIVNDFSDHSKHKTLSVTLIKEHFVVLSNLYASSLLIHDLSLKPHSWVYLVNTLVSRSQCGFGVLDDYLYAVGGSGQNGCLKSAEVLDMNNQEWRMIANMSNKRCNLGIGVLNNFLYAIGGCDDSVHIPVYYNSVECYDPSLNTWTPVAKMSKKRSYVGVGVMDGVLYAVGGFYNGQCLKSVEVYKPSSGVWTYITDMHIPRKGSSVFVVDGLLYVVGGYNYYDLDDEVDDEDLKPLNSIEIYNPSTNTWSIEKMSESMSKIFGGVIVDKALVTRFHE